MTGVCKERAWRRSTINNVRKYGVPPYTVVVVHGGPGAPGSVAAVARGLASSVGVLEPLQTSSSIEGQLRELASVLKEHARVPATLIGHSWGAILSYLTAARYPALVNKLILVGTPPLAAGKRLDLSLIWLSRLSEKQRTQFLSLEEFVYDGGKGDKSESMGRLFTLIARADSYDPIPSEDEVLEYQLDTNVSIIRELRQLMANGELVEMGTRIACPVVAVHGDYDPRPAAAVEGPLAGVIRDFKFVLLEKCGHYPWLERHARDRFYDILREEIA